jgi:hypothetical protein
LYPTQMPSGFPRNPPGAERPLALILQKEYIAEPRPICSRKKTTNNRMASRVSLSSAPHGEHHS